MDSALQAQVLAALRFPAQIGAGARKQLTGLKSQPTSAASKCKGRAMKYIMRFLSFIVPVIALTFPATYLFIGQSIGLKEVGSALLFYLSVCVVIAISRYNKSNK
jgi:hypothetical protein